MSLWSATSEAEQRPWRGMLRANWRFLPRPPRAASSREHNEPLLAVASAPSVLGLIVRCVGSARLGSSRLRVGWARFHRGERSLPPRKAPRRPFGDAQAARRALRWPRPSFCPSAFAICLVLCFAFDRPETAHFSRQTLNSVPTMIQIGRGSVISDKIYYFIFISFYFMGDHM